MVDKLGLSVAIGVSAAHGHDGIEGMGMSRIELLWKLESVQLYSKKRSLAANVAWIERSFSE
ncbi:hypothetical protein [Tunicatimonas pelagia]|uniref:hypothetical protein n=1 Tax=Tunicatimonas pelagia TaxID=931531 RepID=UPI0026663AB7|nr:hypothetical protein [Tunicatimonas pelagia]WKN40477.1 hypothetical protein P0M28_15645 [Tunicatimonas pelagia]